MKLTSGSVPVYTIAGSSTDRNLPDWLSQKKRKRDPEFANRIELLQDFEFEEASQCVRVSEDGNWVMSTGTYKPQIHTHYLPNLALSWARHTDTLNKTFLFLSTDYSKTAHLQEDRSIEFHTPGGCHHRLRLPRYGRDLLYDKSAAELFVPAVGVNANGMGEVYRVNLELGKFMNEFEVEVGGDDTTSSGAGALQGGIRVGGVNTGAVAHDSHGLLAFGTTLGTAEYWDPRMRSKVATLVVPEGFEGRPEVTAMNFHRSGIKSAIGTSNGTVLLYDLRSPRPILEKEQGYGYPITHVEFLTPGRNSRTVSTESKVLSGDRRTLKIWDEVDGTPWTAVEPAVDINCVAWCPDSGMILTANEGKQQHAFFIPQLGPAPKWCTFLDNVVEEMADDPNDPQAFSSNNQGEVYDNYKFLTAPQLRTLNLDHLVGTTNLLRPYMHGFFVAQRLYEEARLIANPSSWEEERAKRVQQKIDKERESRIRGKKKVSAKVNRKLAERILDREEKNERKRMQRLLAKGEDEATAKPQRVSGQAEGLLADSRFARMFQNEEFAVDETSREFQQLNPSTKVEAPSNLDREKGLTAVEEEAIDEVPQSSDEENEGDDYNLNSNKAGASERISSADYRRKGKPRSKNANRMELRVSSSGANNAAGRAQRNQSFGARAAQYKTAGKPRNSASGVVGEKTVAFTPSARRGKDEHQSSGDFRTGSQRATDRRSASNNTFRRM